MNHQTLYKARKAETERTWRGKCKCLRPSVIYWSYKYPSGIHRSGTFESSSIWCQALCSRLALNSHAEPQVPDCVANFNGFGWISRRTQKQISALRDGAVPQFRGQQHKRQKNKCVEMDITHTRVRPSARNKKAIVCLTGSGSSPYWFPWERKSERANRW